MQKAIVFISLFLLVIFLSFVRFSKNESFVNFFGVDFNLKNDGTPPQLNSKNPTLPVTQPYAPNLAEMGVGNILPGPGDPDSLPTAPYGNMSKAVPTPYKDPTVEPAKYIRILGVKEDLQAFFAFQAGPIEDSSDPSIQMPLTRARADVGELVDLQSVLERNPGLPSRMTNKQLEDIQSNLRYLQSILRDLEASGAVGPTPTGVEGFSDSSSTTQDKKPATLEQIQDFQEKIQIEIQRLSATATTDPIITARVSTLTRIAADVTDTIEKIISGFYTPETIPIYESDILKALPVLGKPTDPLPTIVKKFNLPPAISSLFPNGLSPQNKEQAAQINNVVKGYMDQIFEGTSWGIDVNVKYDSPRAEKIYGKNHLDLEVGVPGLFGISEGQQNPFWNYQENTQTGKRQTWDRGVSDTSYHKGLPGSSSRTMPEIQAGGFDWKQRALEITDQVKKRGLDPLLFGAMPSNTVVSDSFNWKGYTNMFCNRLAANYDPGVPQSVGCPSANWPGWKN